MHAFTGLDIHDFFVFHACKLNAVSFRQRLARVLTYRQVNGYLGRQATSHPKAQTHSHTNLRYAAKLFWQIRDEVVVQA